VLVVRNRTRTDTGIVRVRCWHTPSLPATTVSLSQIYREQNFHGFASVRLLEINEVWMKLFNGKNTSLIRPQLPISIPIGRLSL
jgi:predicted metalloprotease